MILLSAEKVSKSYSQRQLLCQVSLGIHEGDKIGVIGANGAGKSTLLRVMAGLDQPDSGTVTRSGGVRVGYLPQNPVFAPGATILEQVMLGVAVEQSAAQEALLHSQAHEFECRRILSQLGFEELDLPVEQLSGGQKRRVAMACAFATPAEVLILDEPTNHIDSETVEWLESHLARFTGALLMVTHDRYFLDRVTNKIAELQGGALYLHPQCSYSDYLERKAQREEMEQASQRKRQSLYRKELEWIQRGAKARGTKARFRVERFEELAAQQGSVPQQQLELGSLSARLGRKIIELDRVTKGFDGRVLIRELSYLLLRGDRVGLIGPNGSGKSTLLNLIAGRLLPDSGSIAVGETVRIGYFSQEGQELDPTLKAIDYIRSVAQEVETPDGTLTAPQMMERFLFPSELQYTEIGRLSGGERRRLQLLRVLMEAPNVLLLDEPTNDLDLPTLTVLEGYLEGFPGAVVAVSHDRYFLDKVMNHVFVFAGDGELRHYLGGYSDYRLEARQQEQQQKKQSAQESSGKGYTRTHSDKPRFSFKEQREYEQIDGVIALLEEQIAQTEEELTRKASDYTALEELTARKEELESQLAHQMDRWVYLNDLAEQIAQQQHSR